MGWRDGRYVPDNAALCGSALHAVPAPNSVRGRSMRGMNMHGMPIAALQLSVRIVLAGIICMAAFIGTGCGPTRCLTAGTFGNLGPEINSPYDDYSPALSDTATFVFTSNRIEPGEAGLQQFYHITRPTRLFFSMRLGAVWDTAQPYQLFMEGSSTQGATIAFAPPGSPFSTIAYVSSCDRADTIGGCDLYALVERQAVSLVNLGREVNSAAWDGQPFVTADGRKLYFASDRIGGFGGTDIWIAERMPSGAWGAPRNAGPGVNTAGDEFSPFVEDATGRLFFASNNLGSGIDIFVIDAGSASRRVLPPPYNSEADDFTPFLLGGTLYLASNRPGGCGGYDLYGFELREEARPGEH
jgi:WD40-like Beta Propeller Repeat